MQNHATPKILQNRAKTTQATPPPPVLGTVAPRIVLPRQALSSNNAIKQDHANQAKSCKIAPRKNHAISQATTESSKIMQTKQNHAKSCRAKKRANRAKTNYSSEARRQTRCCCSDRRTEHFPLRKSAVARASSRRKPNSRARTSSSREVATGAGVSEEEDHKSHPPWKERFGEA